MRESESRGLEKGIEQGIEQGRKEEAVALVLRLLSRRLELVLPQTEAKICSLSLDQSEQLGEALLDFGDCADLEQWLRQIP